MPIAGASTAEPDPPLVIDGDALTPPAASTREATLASLRLSQRSEAIVGALSQQAGDRLGLHWVEGDPGSATGLVVGVAELRASERGQLADRVPAEFRDRVRFVKVKYSRVQLEEYQAAILQALGDTSGIAVGMGLDYQAAEGPQQVIVVTGPKGTEDRIATLVDEIPDDVLRLRHAEVERLHHRNVFPPWLGGLRNEIGSKGNCTSGYMLNGGGFGNFATTAGHCATSGSTSLRVHVGTTSNVDSQRQNHYWARNPTDADVAIYSLSGWAAYPAVKVSDTLNRVVGGRYPGAAPLGEFLCFTGYSTHSQACGWVMLHNDTYNDGVRTTTNHDCIDRTGLGGDSGAPVYLRYGSTGAYAAGTVSYGGTGIMCYSRMNRIVNRTGMEIFVP